MSLFAVPQDNLLTLHRLHYETSRIIKSPDNAITCAHSLNTNKNLNHDMLPEVKYLSENIKRSKVVLKK